MDQDQTYDPTSKAIRHDRWSVLVLALSCAFNIAQDVANTLEGYTYMTVQHANQKAVDKKFSEITKGF